MPTIEQLLNNTPPFEEPMLPLTTRDEMARWLVWQRFEAGSGRSTIQFHRALMTETNTELLWRCQKWPQFHL